MKDLDKVERVLVILIMIVEMLIIFRGLTISTMLGLGLALIFHGLDYIIMQVHQKYFRDNEKRRK